MNKLTKIVLFGFVLAIIGAVCLQCRLQAVAITFMVLAFFTVIMAPFGAPEDFK